MGNMSPYSTSYDKLIASGLNMSSGISAASVAKMYTNSVFGSRIIGDGSSGNGHQGGHHHYHLNVVSVAAAAAAMMNSTNGLSSHASAIPSHLISV